MSIETAIREKLTSAFAPTRLDGELFTTAEAAEYLRFKHKHVRYRRALDLHGARPSASTRSRYSP